jgi:DNA polymerase-3 subunit beta
MRISIDQEMFADIVSRAQSILERKSTRPILENVLLSAENGELVLSATDLRVSLTQKMACEVSQKGSISLPGRKLHEILREVPKGEVFIETKENAWTTITAAKSTFHLPGTPAEEFPTVPTPPEKFQRIRSSSFNRMVEKTIMAASNDETRIYLCGVFFQEGTDEKGKTVFRMVATDGHRLSLVERNVDKAMGLFSEGAIVPKKGVAEMKSLLGLGEEEVEIACGEGKLFSRTRNILLSVTLIDASFPNYQQVIPPSTGKGILVRCDEFRNALRRVSILSDQETRSVVLEVSGNEMKLFSENQAHGDARETIPVEYGGETVKVAFNATYLMEILKVVEDEALRLEIRDSLSPALFLGTDKDADFTAVVMPMRLD